MGKRIGAQSVSMDHPVFLRAAAAIAGPKEKEGPLGNCFDVILEDAEWNEVTWEKTESKMQREAVRLAIQKAGLKKEDINYVFGGDLLNQCIGAGFGLRELKIPFFGIYGACSTMIEGISLAAMAIDGGFADAAAAVTSSHFCTAERQYRMPLEYGGQRTPTAQWTVTGAGAAVLSKKSGDIAVTHITTGKILDMGVKDANHMGGAMAPAALETLCAHFRDLGSKPSDYDLILTGDLGQVGGEVLVDLMAKEGYDLRCKKTGCPRRRQRLRLYCICPVRIYFRSDERSPVEKDFGGRHRCAAQPHLQSARGVCAGDCPCGRVLYGGQSIIERVDRR